MKGEATLEEEASATYRLRIQVSNVQTLHISMSSPDALTLRVLERLVELWNRYGLED